MFEVLLSSALTITLQNYSLEKLISSPVFISSNCSLESNWQPLLKYVQDNLIEYETDSTKPFASETRDKRMLDSDFQRKLAEGYLKDGGIGYHALILPQYVLVINDPPELDQLLSIPDQRILDELSSLLDVAGRGWAAHVLISKLMGEQFVNIYNPNQSGVELVGKERIAYWWEKEGKTGKARKFWQNYINTVRPSMKWQADPGYYKHIRPNGTLAEYCPRDTLCYIRPPKPQ
jgi:hypothetical protein